LRVFITKLQCAPGMVSEIHHQGFPRCDDVPCCRQFLRDRKAGIEPILAPASSHWSGLMFGTMARRRSTSQTAKAGRPLVTAPGNGCCASNPNLYYELSLASQLDSIFDAIARNSPPADFEIKEGPVAGPTGAPHD
jgi:hypothetical protein